MKKELIEEYYTNFLKYENKAWSSQQWYDYCTMILGELMKEHNDVYFELKESSIHDDDDKYGTYRAEDDKPHHRPVHDCDSWDQR